MGHPAETIAHWMRLFRCAGAVGIDGLEGEDFVWLDGDCDGVVLQGRWLPSGFSIRLDSTA